MLGSAIVLMSILPVGCDSFQGNSINQVTQNYASGQLTPSSPCIGQSVTVSSTGTWKNKVTIWLAPGTAFAAPPSDLQKKVRIGEASVDNSGSWSFTWELSGDMGTDQSGSIFLIAPGSTYSLIVEDEGGSTWGQTFNVCK